MRNRSGRSPREEGGGADAAPRASLYDEVTRRIVAELEAGRVPLVQPWGAIPGGASSPCQPRNALTGRSYSGVNILILCCSVVVRGYGWSRTRSVGRL